MSVFGFAASRILVALAFIQHFSSSFVLIVSSCWWHVKWNAGIFCEWSTRKMHTWEVEWKQSFCLHSFVFLLSSCSSVSAFYIIFIPTILIISISIDFTCRFIYIFNFYLFVCEPAMSLLSFLVLFCRPILVLTYTCFSYSFSFFLCTSFSCLLPRRLIGFHSWVFSQVQQVSLITLKPHVMYLFRRLHFHLWLFFYLSGSVAMPHANKFL